MRDAAVFVGKLAGKRVYRVPVIIRHNSSRLCGTIAERRFTVLARSAAEAANWARDHEANGLPETEIIAFGPKGGKVERYIGWFAAISGELMIRRPAQLDMIGRPAHLR